VVHPRAAAQLASVEERVLATEERATPHGRETITFDLPDVDPTTLAHLDDHGVVWVGTRVSPRLVLVGKIAPTAEVDPIDGAFGVPTGRDVSLRCPADVAGEVVEAERRETDAGVRVRIVIRAERPLAVGDVLRTGTHVAVVGAIEPIDADVIWPGAAGTGPVEKIGSAAALAEARSIGPYSSITQQPMAPGRGAVPGQLVHEADVAALRALRARHVLHELTTLKSDDIDGRIAVYESIVRGTWRLPDTLPESTYALEAHLAALGFTMDPRTDTPRVWIGTDASLRDRTRAVEVGRTLDASGRPVPGGLFCETIFGAANDVRGRRRILGRIELPAPVLHPWLSETAATLLGLTPTALDDVLFEGRAIDGSRAARWTDTGGWAIATALGALDLEACERASDARGDLARALRAALPRYAFFTVLTPAAFVRQAWPVLPADLRPETRLPDGRVVGSALNARYAHVVETARALREAAERGDGEAIRAHARLQRAIDVLVDRSVRDDTRPVLLGERDDAPSLADTTDARGHFGAALRGKRVDYSAAATVVGRDVLRGTVAIPLTLALELWKPFVYEALEARGHVKTIKEAKARIEQRDPDALALLRELATGWPMLVFAETPARSPSPLSVRAAQIWDHPAIGLAHEDVTRLGLGPDARAVLHLPLSEAARAEAKALASRTPVALTDGEGWLARASRSTRLGEVLVAAALAREADPVTSDEACLLLGRVLAAP
jgi:DNA-directed RNA polymerase subunit beta-beta'